MLNNEQERLKRQAKKKKILIIAVISVVGLFIVLGLAIFIFSAVQNHLDDQKREELNKGQSYIYPPADYNFNIFTDEFYMNECDRNIWVNDGYTRTVITDDNQKDYPAEILFMRDVINYIISGDYTEYNKIFTDDYLKNAGDDKRERFTMQQLYNIELELIDYTETTGGSNYAVKVTYMIRNNNGTFRNDLDYNDDGSRPVVYMLTSDRNGDTKVTNLMTYLQYKSGLFTDDQNR